MQMDDTDELREFRSRWRQEVTAQQQQQTSKQPTSAVQVNAAAEVLNGSTDVNNVTVVNGSAIEIELGSEIDKLTHSLESHLLLQPKFSDSTNNEFRDANSTVVQENDVKTFISSPSLKNTATLVAESHGNGSETATDSRVNQAVDLYLNALHLEGEGNINDALRSYRQAFKLEPNIEHVLRQQAQSKPQTQARLQSAQQTHLKPKGDQDMQNNWRYHFEEELDPEKPEGQGQRTDSMSLLQKFRREGVSILIADLSPGKPTASAASASTISTKKSSPSSKNIAGTATSASAPDSISSAFSSSLAISNGVNNEQEPDHIRYHIGRLPAEIMIHIFKCLILMETHAFERLALTCRAFYVYARDSSVWKHACDYLYRLYDPASGVRFGNDFRRMFIERPRLRCDGIYISKVTYIRSGEAENSFYQPVHLVTYFRYLRFFPNGEVLSLTSTDEPGVVIQQMKNGLSKIKNILMGMFKVEQETCVQIFVRHLDTANQHRDMQHMQLRLKSTYLGGNNKLNWESYSTVNPKSGQKLEIPHHYLRGYWFSRVRSFPS